MFGEKGGTITYIFYGVLASIPGYAVDGAAGLIFVWLIFGGMAIASYIKCYNSSINIIDRFKSGGDSTPISLVVPTEEVKKYEPPKYTAEDLKQLELARALVRDVRFDDRNSGQKKRFRLYKHFKDARYSDVKYINRPCVKYYVEADPDDKNDIYLIKIEYSYSSKSSAMLVAERKEEWYI